MKIKFETDELTTFEATGLVALLVALHGSSILKGVGNPDIRIAEVVSTHEWAAPTLADVIAEHTPAPDTTMLAPDGYPAEEPDAATAFGSGGGNAQQSEVLVTGGGVNVDSAGIPWDERIHASTKTKTANGNWTRRRNTDDAVFNSVMAELKGGGLPDAGKPAYVEGPDAAPPTLPAPPAAADDGPPPPPTTAAPISFPMLMVKVTKAQTGGKITKADVDGILATFGIASMPALLNATPDTLAAVNAMVDNHVGQ